MMMMVIKMTEPVGINLTGSWDDQSSFDAPKSDTAPQFVVAIKKGIVGALKSALDSPNYPDPILQNISISMEYPTEIEEYPSIWVSFNINQIQTIGLGNLIFTDPGPPIRRYQLWNFGGTAVITIVALTSKERDAIVDKVVQMYAFHALNTHANSFQDFLMRYPYIYMAVNNDELQNQGESVSIGQPWQPDAAIYENSFEMQLQGQFASQFPTGDLIRIDELNLYPYTAGDPSTAVRDGNGRWVGEWDASFYDPSHNPAGPIIEPDPDS